MELVQFPLRHAGDTWCFRLNSRRKTLSVSLSRKDRITTPEYYCVTLNATQEGSLAPLQCHPVYIAEPGQKFQWNTTHTGSASELKLIPSTGPRNMSIDACTQSIHTRLTSSSFCMYYLNAYERSTCRA